MTCDCRYCRECVDRRLGLKPVATDQRTLAERKWREGAKPSKPQKACDIGLFSDDALQADLDLVVEMFQEPTNEP